MYQEKPEGGEALLHRLDTVYFGVSQRNPVVLHIKFQAGWTYAGLQSRNAGSVLENSCYNTKSRVFFELRRDRFSVTPFSKAFWSFKKPLKVRVLARRRA